MSWAYLWEGLLVAVRWRRLEAARGRWWLRAAHLRDYAQEAFELAECARRASERD